ncbi:MAG: hypothetical protein ACW98D_16285 [Promethearchaeota archaeon]|jgi:hypothetical protein
MVEFIQGRLLKGPLVAILGSILLLIGGIVGVSIPEVQENMARFPILYVTFILPIVLGIIGITGAVLSIINKPYGNYAILIVGIIAVIGIFIPIIATFPLVISFIYVDPFLILIGGIVSVVIRE